MSEQPFERFARHYDRFMLRYVDYRSWVDYIEKLFRHYKQKPVRVLDLACGTGIPTLLLAERGYQMVGLDRSAAMLNVLREKSGGDRVELVEADMRDFRLEHPVDAAICLYDSVNYLLAEADLVGCFGSVRGSLVPGGLFAFDMNTLYGLAEVWGNRTTPRNVEGVSSVWENSFDRSTRVSTLRLTFWEEGGDAELPERFEEVHQERAWTRRQVADALRAAGFDESRFYTHGGFLPVAPITGRMMVVAR